MKKTAIKVLALILVFVMTLPTLFSCFFGDEEEYNVTLYTSNNDPYLEKLIGTVIEDTYFTNEAYVLEDLVVPGYYFKGWYTSQFGGEQVTEIPIFSSGDKTYYAQWEKIEYTITFDSPDVPVDRIKYTVDTGATLRNAEWYGYTFVGWSNDDGFIVSSIKPGTTGNITLHANWTSNRNKATSYTNYAPPIIIEDAENGQFLFIYNIGRIDNVPLYLIKDLGNTQRLEFEQTITVTDYISNEQAQSIVNTVMEATTRSSGWTLDKEWNNIYSEGTEQGNVQVKTDERVDSQGRVVGGNYFISNSSGGSTYVSNESGSSSSTTSKVTTDTSVGINSSFDTSTEMYADAKLSASNTTEVSAGVSLPVKVVDVSAGVKNTTTVGAEVSSGRKDNSAFHIDGSYSSYVGTVDTDANSSYYNTLVNTSSTWNSEEAYTKSYETSVNSAVSSAISNQISKTTNYNVSNSLGGKNSETSNVSGTTGSENEYSSVLKYNSGTSNTTEETLKFYSDRPGYYRIVMAGTVHVYAVVGYDVATASYYTYTYNVLDDERHTYLDYSKDNANFNDCENGVVTFKVPYEVNEYVMGVTGKTEGLEYDNYGNVTDFEETDSFEGDVTIPQYYAKDNRDGTYSACKTTSFTADTFRGNENITTVVLPVYVTEIPDNAFEGCTNLETVVAFGVTKIGDNAFSGCTSLRTFAIDNYITHLGKNAFAGVNEITVMAADSAIAEAALASGAKRITLDITKMADSFDNRVISISDSTEFFKLIGGGKTINNLKINSDAKETFISNITFAGNKGTAIRTSSETLTLARVTIENAPGFALIITADNAVVYLYETNEISTLTDNAVISKNVRFEKLDSSSYSKLEVDGGYLVSGSIENDKHTNVTDGYGYISEETFEGMVYPNTVTFDANGGSCNTYSKQVLYGECYGTLPIPEKENYRFDGWYTDDGEQVTENIVVTAISNHILYAHWTYNDYKIYFDANGGEVSIDYKTVTYYDRVGELPIPTRDYYNFLGWYMLNGYEMTEDMLYELERDCTLVAKWELKPTSGWVRAEDVPAGAEVLDRKYTYTKTYYTTSDSPELEGWEYSYTHYTWSEYGPWSEWTTKSIQSTDSVKVETATVYEYYYYPCPHCGTHMHGWDLCYTWAEGCGKVIAKNYTDSQKYWNLIYFTKPYSQAKDWYGTGKKYIQVDGEYYFARSSENAKTGYRYCERTQIATYHFSKIENLESASVPNGENVSNVQEWVQYREK